MHKCGVKVQGVEQCWFTGHKGKGHYLRAEELANGLRRSIIPGVQPVKEFPGKNFQAHILGATGIIFLRTTGEEKILPQENKKLSGTEAEIILTFGMVLDLRLGGRGPESMSDLVVLVCTLFPYSMFLILRIQSPSGFGEYYKQEI